jgi:opacity protein-like surface antigen
MKALLGALALSAALLAGSAQAATITFDDRGQDRQVLTTYEGLEWTNMETMKGNLWGNHTGYAKGVVSPKNIAFNGEAVGVSKVAAVDGSTFNFESAYFTAAWLNGLKLKITGLLNGVTVESTTLTLSRSGPQLFDAHWMGIDELTFESYIDECTTKGRQFVMDNLNISSGVPEPSTWAVMMVGFAGIGMMIRSTRGRRALAGA